MDAIPRKADGRRIFSAHFKKESVALQMLLIGRVDQNCLQEFYKRFSGQGRAPVSDRQGADARRDATSGHFICFGCPGAGALD